MKTSGKTPLVPRIVKSQLWTKTMLLAGLASLHSGHAQQIVAPLTIEPESARTDPSSQVGNSPASRSAGEGSLAPAPASPLEWGPFNIRPHIIYRILYSDGLQSTPGHPTSTTINTFAPGFLAELGTHWSFDYTPSWNEYSSHQFRDTLDHAAKLIWGTAYEEWVFHASQDYNRSTSPQIQTAQQTRETDYLTDLNVSYQFAGDLTAETALSRSVRLVEAFNDTRQWSIRELFHLKESAELDSALGAEYGYVKTSNSPDMSFVQFLARVAWRMSEKLNLELQGGLENRHIKQTGAANLRNPVLTTTLHYRPVETTQLSFSSSRTTSVSYFSNQIVENSTYAAGLDQRLLTHFQLAAGAEYQDSQFRSTTPSTPNDRKDKNYSFTLGLRTVVFHRLDLTFQYRKSHNSSSVPGFGFSSNQVGLELGYHY